MEIRINGFVFLSLNYTSDSSDLLFSRSKINMFIYLNKFLFYVDGVDSL